MAEGVIRLAQAAAKVQAIFDRLRWKYCFIGGLAVQKWGQVRVTDDIDLTILTGFGKEESFIEPLLEHFTGRIPHAAKFAIQSRVLLLQDDNGIGIDISLGAFPFEQSAIARARKVAIYKNIRLKLATAEDLIIYKAFANRPIDWMDIEGIIAKQGKKKLAWRHVFDQLRPLVELKEDPEIIPKLKTLIREVGRNSP